MNADMINPEAKQDAQAWNATVLLVLVGLLVYCNSFNKSYVFDDFIYLSGSKGLKDPAEIFTTWGSRWATGLTFLVTDRLGGGTVGWHHAGNVAIHIIAALALFGIVRRTLLLDRWRGRFSESATWLATACALLWLVHPLNTMAVTYLIQRLEAQMGMFYLLTLYCFIRAATTAGRRWGWYCLSVVCCFLGMGSKEVMFTCPLVVLIYDWVFLSDSPWRAVRQRWVVYLALFGCWGIHLTTIRGAMVEERDPTVGFGVRDISSLSYFRTQMEVVLYYLRLSFWPSPLTLDYQDWQPAPSWSSVLPSAIVTGGLVLASAVGLLLRTWWGFLGAWFFGILSVSSSFIPIIDMAFEHRMYLSLAAVCVLVVILLDGGIRWVGNRLRWADGATRGVFLGCIAVLAGVLAVTTVRRNHDFRDLRTIWSDVVKNRPGSARGYSSLGEAISREGKFEEAEPSLRTALQLYPHAPSTNHNLGIALYKLGRSKEASEYFRRAIRGFPAHTLARNYLGIILLQEGQVEQALAHLKKAVATSPHDVRSRINLGAALDAKQQTQDADAEYAESLRLDPDWPREQAEYVWNLLLSDDSKPHEAKDALFIAGQICRATGFEEPAYLDLLGVALAANGEYDRALEMARKAQRIATERQEDDLAEALAVRIQLYRNRKPYTRNNVAKAQIKAE